MITTKGHLIEINGVIEWTLFNRMRKFVSPIDFLILTDSLIQLPNFLFTVSLSTILFIDTSLWMKLLLPCLLFLFGSVIVNFRIGIGDIGTIKYPLMLFASLNQFTMLGVFITSFFFIGWWALLITVVYALAFVMSLLLLTSNEKKYYKAQWGKEIGNYEIFKNNIKSLYKK